MASLSVLDKFAIKINRCRFGRKFKEETGELYREKWEI